MGFASGYLKERTLFPQLIKEVPDKNTGIIVVIPAFDEPVICKLLDSLALCREPECGVELIVIVNAPSDATSESLENNLLTIRNIEGWKQANTDCFFRLYPIRVKPVIKKWGVGPARKTGMDEAVRRFDIIEKPEGVILNLDADCTVEPNYFIAVCEELFHDKKHQACSVYFEHPLEGTEFEELHYRYITLYELHLRYYYQGLLFTGFPSVFHTVGSALAVKALSYVRSGGMNRKQAGEDFYFIQKLIPAGGYFYLTSTTIHPSPRASGRVPFGTGASMAKLVSDKSTTLLSYDFQAFVDLRNFFAILEDIFNSDNSDLHSIYQQIPKGIKLFINQELWVNKLSEIRDNTSGYPSFRKRFFGWFNMFMIVKYLNFVHRDYLVRKDVVSQVHRLLRETGVRTGLISTSDILQKFREMEKNC